MAERAKIPSFPDRIHTHEHLIELALHELNCILVGYHLGHLGNISMEAESEFLACVTFQGNIPLRYLQIIAVAGKISAQGLTQSYNSDITNIQKIGNYFVASDDVNEDSTEYVAIAYAIAQAILSYYPASLRKQAAKIIAERTEVKSYEIPAILKRAKADLLREKQYDYCLLNLVIPEEKMFEQNEFETNSFTNLENIGHNNQRIIIVNEEGEELTLNPCPACGGINRHPVTCYVINNKRNAKQRTDKNRRRISFEENIDTFEYPDKLDLVA